MARPHLTHDGPASRPCLPPRTSACSSAILRVPLFVSEAAQREAGLTLVELIITVAILGILAGAAVPTAKFAVKRQKERELRDDLWEIRSAIDHYKDAADRGAFQTKADSFNYPPDLDTLVQGVDVGTKKLRFLRKLPTDPMTGNAEWDTRSMQDDPDDAGGGSGSSDNVFDVHSKSTGTALDGTKYNTW